MILTAGASVAAADDVDIWTIKVNVSPTAVSFILLMITLVSAAHTSHSIPLPSHDSAVVVRSQYVDDSKNTLSNFTSIYELCSANLFFNVQLTL